MQVEEGYEIRLPQFEGPFDLLLFFIERDELNIHDIPISKITDDFLSYVSQMQALNMEMASEFIFVASTLMRIKAKMLLPRPELDENENEIDLREDLVQKLILYKQFKDICESLREMEENRLQLYSRGNIQYDIRQRLQLDATGENLDSFDLYGLMMIYEQMMYQFRNRPAEVTHTVVKYPYTIEQQKKAIAELIEINKKLDFQELLKNSENKVQFVYNFLAILEMLQQRLLQIEVGLGYNNFNVEERDPKQEDLVLEEELEQ
ncbi:MAG: chromosome segregation protein ScpA [Sphingobacterium sp.]|jgi:segregation and condensation protein A|uniref:segregation and condensation protein A n=1 Tax=unclassified Sphingobacterium TaxID=2609468 RepID=UPI000985A213|nr:segregation/condensation protein A [Sphingobacterium sp. CZ-UAM]MDF2518101.1 chromosome segregation protein ScpA [Sphingobacterium sp.]OOG18265.1 chromosome segregation protein ScpA [Sphingobacterium sp. CZ-UAM]